MIDDIGRFVGRYLQILAGLAVIGMVASLFRGSAHIDPSFILLFWAGASLVRHSQLGRRLVIIGSALACAGALAVLVVASFSSLASVEVRILGAQVTEPTTALVAGLGTILLVLAMPPLLLLLTAQARREFGVARQATPNTRLEQTRCT
jgi:hypothetical protein